MLTEKQKLFVALMEMTDEELCNLYDTGQFNRITAAYIALALKAQKKPVEDIKKTLWYVTKAYQKNNAAEALEAGKKLCI